MVDELDGGQPSLLNLAVSDGNRAAACRFTNDPDGTPESLYMIERELYEPVSKDSPGRRPHEASRSFVVSSERLTDDPLWRTIQRNQLVSFARDARSRLYQMQAEGLVPA